MINRFIAGLTLVSFLGLGLPVAALSADSQSGEVEAHRGKVLVKSSSGWNELGLESLEAGDVIRTGQDGEVILKFPGDSRVRLAANSQLQVKAISDTSAQLNLERGKVLGNASGALNVSTHRTSTVASQGEFVLQTTADGTRLNVLNGDAKLTSNDEVTLSGAEGLPEGVDPAELSALEGIGDIQVEGVIADADSEGNGDDDDEGEGGGDNTAWALGGVGLLVIGGVLIATGGDDDDDIVGTPSPNLP